MKADGYALSNGVTVCPICHEKAEAFFRNEGKMWEKGTHPDEIYAKIGSSYERALEDCKALEKEWNL